MKALSLSLLTLSLAATAHADSYYLFAGDRVSNPARGGSIHRYELDAANPTVLKPAPSAGSTDAYWDKSAGKSFAGKRINDMVVAPNGDVYATSDENKSVIRFDGKTGAPKGEVITGLNYPAGITIGPDGLLYIACYSSVVRCTLDGKPAPGAQQIDSTFSTGGNLVYASGIAFGPDGNLYVSSQGTQAVLRYDGKTGFLIDTFHGGGVHTPSEIAWGPDGNLYVASTGGPLFNAESGYVAKIDGRTGKKIDSFATDAKSALGIAFGPDGNLIVTDYFTAQIKRYDAKTGKLLGQLASSPVGGNFCFLALAKKPAAPNAALVSWNIDVPKRAVTKTGLLPTSLGSATVKGWQNALAPQGVAGPKLTLASASKTAYVIAVPANPSTQDQKAAVVLAWYLKEMTGATFPIVREGKTKLSAKVISVGKTNLWKNAALPQAKVDLADEGYAIDAKGDNLFLWGGKTRSAIYAVDSLLEEDLGVRWYTSESNSERVPRVNTLAFSPRIRHFKPVLYVRDPYYFEAFSTDWSIKNKTNSYNAPVPNAWGGSAKHALFCHTYNTLVPPEKYFATHPEYFAEVGGKRQTTQLELTNPDVLKIVIEEVKKHLRENPDASLISVSPNDGRGYSESKESRAIDEAEAMVPGSKSGTLIWFVNQVAEAIEPEFPNVKVSTLAYLDTVMPPKTIRPRKNVVIQLCTDSHGWVYQLNYITETQKFQTAMLAWHKIGAPLHIWDYTTAYVHMMVPMPNMAVITPNMRWMIAHGATGIMFQGNFHSTGGENSPMRSWVWAKQLWNPSLDTKALMKDFIYGYYGDAAEPMWNYNMMLWDMWTQHRKQPHTPGVTPVGTNPLLLDSPTSTSPDWAMLDQAYVNKSTKFFDQAMALTKDPITRKRVETAKLSLLYVKLGKGVGWITEFGDYHTGAVIKARNASEKKRYLKMMDEYERIANAAGVTFISERSSVQLLISRWRELLNQPTSDIPVVQLANKWKFKPDAQNVGLTQNWQAVVLNDNSWADVYSNKNNGWEAQGFPDHKGWSWYHQSFSLPADFKLNKKLYLYFNSVDSECEIYLNGTKVADHTIASTGIPLETIWNEPFAVDVAKFWKVGLPNQVSVRVTSAGGVRGIWKPAFLISTDDEQSVGALKSLTIPYQ